MAAKGRFDRHFTDYGCSCLQRRIHKIKSLNLGNTLIQIYSANHKSTGCPRIGILIDLRVINPLISTPEFSAFVFLDNLSIGDPHLSSY